MKRIHFVFVILIASILASCASSPSGSIPSWVMNVRELFPEDRYMASVAEASTLDSARKKAAAEIASVFRMTINADTQFESQYKAAEKDLELIRSREESFSSSVSRKVNEDLINVKYGESYISPEGRVYATAYLDRKETFNIYTKKMRDLDKDVVSLTERGLDSDELIKQFSYLDLAVTLSLKVDRLQDQLSVIYPKGRTVFKSTYSTQEISEERDRAAHEMVFSVSVQGVSEEKIQDIVSSELNRGGFYVSDDGLYSVSVSLTTENVDLDNKYVNRYWTLDIVITGQDGKTLVSFNERSRESQINESALNQSILTSVEGVIKKKLLKTIKKQFLTTIHS